MRPLVAVLLAGALSCATAPAQIAPLEPTAAPTAPIEPVPVPPPPPETCTSFAKPGVLRRSLVGRTVSAGLGMWLKGVEVDASVQKGRFRGWVIRRLYPDDLCYREVDLRPGDMVVKVNGKSIERPEQAKAVFDSLLTAPALVVERVRGGMPATLTFPIADE